MEDQWIRKASLVVAQDSGEGLDLSEFHFRFDTQQADIQSPNIMIVRIYNMAETTRNTIKNEFSRVVLQAGYEQGNYGIIFDGNIKQVRSGRENETDTFVEILAADGDQAYNFATVNTTIAAGCKPEERLTALQSTMGEFGVIMGYVPDDLPGPRLPRGKVLYGMSRDHLRDLAKTLESTWSINNGKLEMIPLTGYKPTEAVVLTSKTGLIGRPEQTQDGVKAKCLLNPNLVIGGKVQIDNKSVQEMAINMEYTAINFRPQIAADGFYRLLVVAHSGDTRGDTWYSELVCLGLDDTVPMSMAARGIV